MSLAAIQAAFPDRPLSIDAPVSRWRAWLTSFVLLAILVGFGWWAVTAIVPTIISDLQIRDGAVPVNGRVESGRCRSQVGMLHMCDMTLVSSAPTKDGQPLRQSANYIFVQPHLGDFTVQLLADPTRPGQLTTDMGLEHLTNRVITFTGLAVALLAMGYGGVILMRAGGRARRDMQALSGRQLIPVAVQVGRDRQGWQVRPEGGPRSTLWPMPKKAEPFWIAPDVALGVTTPGGPVFALDQELSWADFSEEERRRLRLAAQA